MANLQDTDIVIVGRGVTTYHTTFEDFKSSVIADDGVGKGDIRVVVGNGLTSSGDATHNANQQINTQQNLEVKTGLGITFDSNGGVSIDPSVSYVKDEYIPSLSEVEGNKIINNNLEVNPLKGDDKIVLHRDGVDYSFTGQQIKRYVNEVDNEEDPPLGQWFHVKNIRGGRLRINSNSGSVQAIDVLGEAIRSAWYQDIGLYHYGRSIRIWDCGDDHADPNLDTFETWGDIGEVSGGEEYVDSFFNDLNLDKSNFLRRGSHR